MAYNYSLRACPHVVIFVSFCVCVHVYLGGCMCVCVAACGVSGHVNISSLTRNGDPPSGYVKGPDSPLNPNDYNFAIE